MAIRLVTFDCANTLLKGRWDPVGFALWAARDAGLCLPARAGERYGVLLRRRYSGILAANRTGDYFTVQEEYVKLGEEWLSELDVTPTLAKEVVEASGRLLFDPQSGLFEPFDDVIATLSRLRSKGVRLAICSNWDASLEGVLEAHGLRELVDNVYASLVVGAEKPDPTMLQLAMKSAGAVESETLHVGDDRIDDLGAAQNAGVTGILIDRNSVRENRKSLVLSNLGEVLDWID